MNEHMSKKKKTKRPTMSVRAATTKSARKAPKRKPKTVAKRWPTYEQWESFARVCWMEAQAVADDSGQSEELFESIGRQACHLGLACSFVPEDEREPEPAAAQPVVEPSQVSAATESEGGDDIAGDEP